MRTPEGTKKAMETMLVKYGGEEGLRMHFQSIGAIGGKKGKTGGFAFPLLCDCEYTEELHKKASCAGYKGGKISKRRSNEPPEEYLAPRI